MRPKRLNASMRAVCGTSLLALAAAQTSAVTDAGDLLWRFEIEADFLTNAPTVGDDGTIFVSDTSGNLYAINPDGSSKWTVDALRGQSGNADEGPVAVFPDGTVLVATNPLGAPTELVAYSADGTFKWVRTFTESISWFAGPTIGPDGLAYAAQSGPMADDQVLSIDSDGVVQWSVRADPDLFEENPIGSEIAFVRDGSQDLLAFHCDQNTNGKLFTFDAASGSQELATFVSSVNAPFMQHLQLQVASDYVAGRMYMTAFGWGSSAWGMRAFNADGSVAWTYDPTIASEASAPAVGPDGTIYVAWDLLRLGAVRPDGSQKWRIIDDTPIRKRPAVDPLGEFVVVTGMSSGQNGRVEAFDAQNGASLWNTPMTIPVTGSVTPSSDPTIAPDGSAVYFGSSVFTGADVGSYIFAYALRQTPAPCATDLSGDQRTDVDDLNMVLAAFGQSNEASDVTGDGMVDVDDLNAILAVFGSDCP